MRKRIILSLFLLAFIITLTTAFIPSFENIENGAQANFSHPEAGYVESIGN